MYVYHVVTDKPMIVGQKIKIDETHRSGVYQRVHEKFDIVHDIYMNPDKYKNVALEHHTSVALRELALEEVRLIKYSNYPSRMACLYVTVSLEEAIKWSELFVKLGRPTYHIVKLDVQGNYFIGDATKCFQGSIDKLENLRLAEVYWENKYEEASISPIHEMLIDGEITVVEIIQDININIV